MHTPRMFFLISLCSHILVLAFTQTLTITSARLRASAPLKVMLLQPTPLPVGETIRAAKALQPAAPAPTKKAQPELRRQPKVTRKKASKQTPVVAQHKPKSIPQQPSSVSPPGLEQTLPTASEELQAEDIATALGGAQNSGSQGGGSAGTGLGEGLGASGDGKILASPDYGVNPKPPYPVIARRMGLEGVVLLKVQVQPDGSVAQVQLSRSSGFSLLDDSAIKTVQEYWRFLPARLGGEAVESWVEVPIQFVLSG